MITGAVLSAWEVVCPEGAGVLPTLPPPPPQAQSSHIAGMKNPDGVFSSFRSLVVVIIALPVPPQIRGIIETVCGDDGKRAEVDQKRDKSQLFHVLSGFVCLTKFIHLMRSSALRFVVSNS